MAQNSTSGEQHYTFLAKPFDVKILSETVKKCLALNSGRHLSLDDSL
jgi:hypothetical protein